MLTWPWTTLAIVLTVMGVVLGNCYGFRGFQQWPERDADQKWYKILSPYLLLVVAAALLIIPFLGWLVLNVIPILWGFTIVFLVGYGVARIWHVLRLHIKLGRRVRFQQSQNGVDVFLAQYSKRANQICNLPMEVVAVGAVTGYEAFYALSLIDPRVIEAADRVYIADLSDWGELGDWAERITQMAPASQQGAFSQLLGHVGEQYVAANLIADGHAVEFPDSVSQEGFDLIVDGSLVQVKTTMSPELIQGALVDNPEIPIITNIEMASHFGDHPSVSIDEQLVHADVSEAVEGTVDGIGSLSEVGLTIPFVTTAVVGFREVRLLLKGWTDLGTAIKYGVIDIAGVAGGGTVGAVVGLVGGGVIGGPIGAAIGKWVGGVGGALIGKMFAQAFKETGLLNARKEYGHSLLNAAREYVNALCKRSKGIRIKRRDIRRVRWRQLSWKTVFWPRASDLVYRRVRATTKKQSQRIYSVAENLQTELDVDTDPHNAAQKVLETMQREPAYSHGLEKALRRMKQAYVRVVIELRRLGRPANLPL